jgi:hypothetical protein
VKDPSAAISEAVFAKARAAAGVQALLGDPARIHDKAPVPPVYPYARVGDDQVTGESNACFDGWEVFVTVHSFSRDPAAPRLVVKDIMNAIAQAIGNDEDPPLPSGFAIGLIALEQSRTFYEDDGVTAHGVQTFSYRVTETA